MTIATTNVRAVAENTLEAAKTPDTGLPPVNDAIAWFQNIDWADVRQRCRTGVNNCGLAIAVIGEKMHDLGIFLSEV